jgi:hypothetical protein
VLYLHLKGLKPTDIHRDLIDTLGGEAVSYPTVSRYIRETKFTVPKTLDYKFAPPPQLPDSDTAILLALEEQPFASVRTLARLTHLPKSTVYRRLTRSLGFRVRHLRWVPHILTVAHRHDRIQLSGQLLSLLQKEKRNFWKNIVTLDE